MVKKVRVVVRRRMVTKVREPFSLIGGWTHTLLSDWSMVAFSTI